MRYVTLLAIAAIGASLTLASPESARAGQTFFAAGTWHTTVHAGNELAHMKLVIQQKGSSVSGTYGKGGSVTGFMKNYAFSGQYKDGSGNGWVNFQFSNDGMSFVGNYGSSPGIVAGNWSGTKVLPTHATETDTHVPAPSPAPAPTH